MGKAVADKSAIEWTEATWNPVTGCSKVSPGCLGAHCYAETVSLRFGWSKKPWTPENAAENVVLHPERLDQPLRWRRPRMIFVNSMSDLFHELIPDDYVREVFRVMHEAKHHIFQVLTKRPERARAVVREILWRGDDGQGHVGYWDPSPNVWLGVSIENARYTWRADMLREIPAAVRFISAEPLLGSLVQVPGAAEEGGGRGKGSPDAENVGGVRKSLDLTGIDWLIVGGESGRGARPMHPEWARELRDACLSGQCPHGGEEPCAECVASRTAFFFKQWGEWGYGSSPGVEGERDVVVAYDGTCARWDRLWDPTLPERKRWLQDGNWPRLVRMARIGKKAAGRILDGCEWNEMPGAARAAELTPA